MKKWIIPVLALLALTLLPSPGTELGELQPISLLMVEAAGKEIRLSTDTMDAGVGETLDGALRNLEDTTTGHVFLDTVENLVITKETRFLLPELKRLLRPTVRVCMTEAGLDMEMASNYLHSHTPQTELRDTDETTLLEKLTWMEERYLLGK